VTTADLDSGLDARGLHAPGTTTMVVGSLAGAVAAYLFQVVGGRLLGPEGFAPVGTLWTVFFIVATVVLVPVEQYVTREASLGRRVLGPAARRPLLVMTAVATTVSVVFAAVTVDDLFEGRLLYALQLALLTVGYAGMVAGKGILAGHRRFAGVGWILVGEGVVRLLAAGFFVLILSPSGGALAWAMVCAPLAASATRFWRVDAAAEEPGRPGEARAFLGAYVAGSAASQVLLAGAPLAVAAVGGSAVLVSVAFVTWTLFRGPLTLIYSLQGRLLAYLVRGADHPGNGNRRVSVVVAGGGGALVAVGGLVGWWIGPEVVALLYGADFAPGPVTAGLVAGGVVAASAAQVAGQVLVAAGATGRLARAWLLGLGVAAAAVAAPVGAADVRVAAGFAAGEVAALLVVAAETLRRPQAEPDAVLAAESGRHP